MKRKTWKRKIVSILLLMFIMIWNGSVVMAEDEKKKEKDYEIQNMTDGTYDKNGSLSVTLKVNSNKKDFNGTIKLYVGNTEWSPYASTAYEKPISIEKGKEKEIVFDVGYSVDATGKLWYELIDENGTVVYEKEGSFNYKPLAMNLKMGILTDDFSKFAFLNEGGVFSLELWGECVNFAIEGLNESTFPDDISTIDQFSFLFIDQFYTGKLSDKQMDTLLQWLKSGGMLIIGTGANAVDTLSGFDGTDFGVNSIGEVRQQEVSLMEDAVHEYQNSLCGKHLAEEDKVAMVSLHDIETDFNVESYYDYGVIDSYYVIREYGSGYAFVYPFSFTDENMSAPMKKTILAASTIDTYSQSIADALDEQLYVYYDYYDLKKALSLLNDIKIPNAVVYLLIFGVYMLVATFITYLVLKKKDKREYIWIAIPGWAVIFTFVIMLVSRSSRVTKPIESSVTVVNLNGDQKNSTSFIALTTPDTKGYELNFNSDVTNVIATLDSSYSSYNTVEDIRNSVDYTLKENSDGFSMEVDKAKVFEYKYVQTSKNEITEERIDVNIDEDGVFCKGTVTNNTDYDLICVIAKLNGVYYNIGDLKKGETKNFSEKMDGGYYYNYKYDNGSKQENNRVEALMGLCNNLCYGGGSLSNYVSSGNIIAGIVRDYDVDFIKNEDFNEYNTAIYTQTLDNSEIGLRVEYNMDDYINDYTGDYDFNDGEMYSDSVEMIYMCKNIEDNTSFYVVNKGSRSVDYATAAQVYFYNVNTGDYDLVFDDSNIVDIKDYITPSGELRAKFTKEGKLEKDTWVYGIPYLYMFGGNSDVEN